MTEASQRNPGYDNGLHVYRRILDHALKYWRHLLISILGMVVYAATDTGFAALIKPMLDGSFVKQDPQTIRWIPVALLAIFILRGVGGYLSAYYMAYVGRRVVKEIRGDMFAHLLRVPVHFFDATSSGQLISKLTYNVEQVANASTKSLTVLVRDTLTIVGLLAWMFYVSWMLTLSFLLVSPLIAALVAYISKRFRRISRTIQDTMGNVTHVIEEMIGGHRVVKVFGGEDYERREFERVNERNRKYQMKMVATRAAAEPLMELLVGLALIGIVFLATREALLESITVGTFVSFIIAMTLLLPPARRLTQINATLQAGIAAGESVFELIDSEREMDTGATPLVRCRGVIEYRHVHFSYDPAKGEVLKGIAVTIQPGETIALIGRSGSGKSTLVNLLPRFYEPQSGEVRLDGVDIRDYRLRDLREQIAYVSQEVVLFNDTIARNIAYGREDASRERILEAARAAHAEEFIERLPDGLDSLIGEKGVLLSGGQRQRLAIARALLKDAPVLILDEATSSLDTEAERHIQAALEALLKNRTTLVIAHRLSTVEKADRILVMQDGRIVETGNHRELLAKNGLYASLYRMQFEAPKAKVAGQR